MEQKSWDLEDSGQKHPYPMLQIFTKKPCSSDSRFSIHFSRIRDKTAVSLNYPLLKFWSRCFKAIPGPYLQALAWSCLKWYKVSVQQVYALWSSIDKISNRPRGKRPTILIVNSTCFWVESDLTQLGQTCSSQHCAGQPSKEMRSIFFF